MLEFMREIIDDSAKIVSKCDVILIMIYQS